MEKHLTLRHNELELAATLHYPTDGNKNDSEKNKLSLYAMDL